MSAPETVGPDALAAALGLTGDPQKVRAELYRARGRGEIPDPDRATLGGFARWSLPLAIEIVKSKGRPVPAAWTAAASAAGGGA